MESGDDIASLKAALAAMTVRAIAAEADAANAKADAAYVKARLTTTIVLIESLKLEIARLRRESYGQTSERGARLIDQLEFQLEELETDRAEDEVAADAAAPNAGRPEIERRRRHPVKKAFSDAAAARAGRRGGAHAVRLLRLGATGQTGRRRHRDARSDPPPLQDHPDRAREIHLPGLRKNQPTAGAVSCHRPRPCRRIAPGHAAL